MPKETAIITGDKAINRKLKAVSGKEGKKVVRKGQRAALKPIQKRAKQNARAHKQSGDFEKSIKIRGLKRTRKGIGTRVTSGKSSGFEQTYGANIEFGTDEVDAQENLTEAAASKAGQALDNYSAEIGRGLIALAKK